MSFQSISRIFFATVIFSAVILIANFAHAAPSAIDSALNNSLKDSQVLSNEMTNPNSARPKPKSRRMVEINLDEADAYNAATYRDVQASGDLRESSY